MPMQNRNKSRLLLASLLIFALAITGIVVMLMILRGPAVVQ
ncbi:MAG: hypothetical protein ACK5LK_12205 [Chthoniobacterales bacterium]